MIVNLRKKRNFTISALNDGGVIVNSSSGGATYSSTVGTSESSSRVIGIADQILYLHDGKTLKRIRDNIFIE